MKKNQISETSGRIIHQKPMYRIHPGVIFKMNSSESINGCLKVSRHVLRKGIYPGSNAMTWQWDFFDHQSYSIVKVEGIPSDG